MILDKLNEFSDAQAITIDAVGTNVIDLSLDRAIGTGEPMCVVFSVDVAADQTSGDEDYAFEVEYASDAAQTTARKRIGLLVFESGTPDAPGLNADLLVAGFQFVIPIPPTTKALSERYLGIRYDVTGNTPTVTITAHLRPMAGLQMTDEYASGFTIS